MSKRKEKTIMTEPGETQCLMKINPLSGFASKHTHFCAASIKIGDGQYQICEEPGASRHARFMSTNKKGDGSGIMSCMNVCVACAERVGDSEKGDGIIGDAVYFEPTEPAKREVKPRAKVEPIAPAPVAESKVEDKPKSTSRSEAAKRAWDTIRRNRAAKLAASAA